MLFGVLYGEYCLLSRMVTGVLWIEIIGVIGLRFRERCFEVWMIDFEKDGCQSAFFVCWSESSRYEKYDGFDRSL